MNKKHLALVVGSFDLACCSLQISQEFGTGRPPAMSLVYNVSIKLNVRIDLLVIEHCLLFLKETFCFSGDARNVHKEITFKLKLKLIKIL